MDKYNIGNRVIKFRAWDKNSQKMTFVDHLTWGKGLGKDKKQELSEVNDEMPKWFALMQFTGLLDKEGKEIYEGDVVNLNCFACDEDCDGEHKRVIEMEDGDFWPYMECIEPKKSEVIGNIFENSDLLNQKES